MSLSRSRRARDQRVRCLLPGTLLPRDVGNRGVRTQIIRIVGEDLAIVPLRPVAVGEEVPHQIRERAMDLDALLAWRLVIETLREQICEVIVGMKAKGNTIILVEQNFHVASLIADRHYIMEDGHVVDIMKAADVKQNIGKLQAYLGV